MKLKIAVSVDKTIDELGNIINEVEELKELVPEWKNVEAEQLIESIYKRLNTLIEVVDDK